MQHTLICAKMQTHTSMSTAFATLKVGCIEMQHKQLIERTSHIDL